MMEQMLLQRTTQNEIYSVFYSTEAMENQDWLSKSA
jgi:hypothetical protein